MQHPYNSLQQAHLQSQQQQQQPQQLQQQQQQQQLQLQPQPQLQHQVQQAQLQNGGRINFNTQYGSFGMNQWFPPRPQVPQIPGNFQQQQFQFPNVQPMSGSRGLQTQWPMRMVPPQPIPIATNAPQLPEIPNVIFGMNSNLVHQSKQPQQCAPSSDEQNFVQAQNLALHSSSQGVQGSISIQQNIPAISSAVPTNTNSDTNSAKQTSQLSLPIPPTQIIQNNQEDKSESVAGNDKINDAHIYYNVVSQDQAEVHKGGTSNAVFQVQIMQRSKDSIEKSQQQLVDGDRILIQETQGIGTNLGIIDENKVADSLDGQECNQKLENLKEEELRMLLQQQILSLQIQETNQRLEQIQKEIREYNMGGVMEVSGQHGKQELCQLQVPEVVLNQSQLNLDKLRQQALAAQARNDNLKMPQNISLQNEQQQLQQAPTQSQSQSRSQRRDRIDYEKQSSDGSQGKDDNSYQVKRQKVSGRKQRRIEPTLVSAAPTISHIITSIPTPTPTLLANQSQGIAMRPPPPHVLPIPPQPVQIEGSSGLKFTQQQTYTYQGSKQAATSNQQMKKKNTMQIWLGSFQTKTQSADGSIDVLSFLPVNATTPNGFYVMLEKKVSIPRGFTLGVEQMFTQQIQKCQQLESKDFGRYRSPLCQIKLYQFTKQWKQFGLEKFTLDLNIQPNWPMCQFQARGECRDPNCEYQMERNFKLKGRQLQDYLQGQLFGRKKVSFNQEFSLEEFVKENQINNVSVALKQVQQQQQQYDHRYEKYNSKAIASYHKYCLAGDRFNCLSVQTQLNPSVFNRNLLEMLVPGYGPWQLLCPQLSQHPDFSKTCSYTQKPNMSLLNLGQVIRNDERRYYRSTQKQTNQAEKQTDSENDDDERAFMYALKLLKFGYGFGEQESFVEVIKFLYEALEKFKHSLKLYPFYLQVFQLKLGLHHPFDCLQQLFEKLLQEGKFSYSLAITVLQIASNAELKVKILSQSITYMVYKMKPSDEQEFQNRADCVLDLFLRMLHEMCIAGQGYNARKWVQELVEDLSCTMVPEKEEDNEKYQEQGANVGCKRAVVRCLHFHMEQAAIFWLCCAYLIVYEQLPRQVVHRFGYKQAPFVNVWFPLPATLSAANRTLLVDVMRLACSEERMCIPILTNMTSKSSQQIRQAMCMNAILFDIKLLPGFLRQLFWEWDFDQLFSSTCLENLGLGCLLDSPAASLQNSETVQEQQDIENRVRVDNFFVRQLAVEVTHDWFVNNREWTEWLIKILMWVAWMDSELEKDNLVKMAEKSKKIKDHQLFWYCRAIVALNSINRHACIRVLAKGASGAGEKVTDVEDADTVYQWFMGVVDEGEFRNRRASSLDEEGEILDEEKVVLDPVGQVFGLLNLALYQSLVGRTEQSHESLQQAMNLSEGTAYYWIVVQNYTSYFQMGANDGIRNQLQDDWSGWKSDHTQNKQTEATAYNGIQGFLRQNLFTMLTQTIIQAGRNCEQLKGLQYPALNFRYEEVEKFLSPPVSFDWTPVNDIVNQFADKFDLNETFVLMEALSKHSLGNPGCIPFLLQACSKMAASHAYSLAWSVPLCFSVLGCSIPCADESLWFQFLNFLGNQQLYVLDSTFKQVAEAALSLWPGSLKLWKKLLSNCKGEQDRKEIQRRMDIHQIYLG